MRRVLWFAGLLLLQMSGPALADNPFGLMLWPESGQPLSMVAARAAALGVAWFRPPALFVDRLTMDPHCAGCQDLRHLGLSLVVTLRNGGHDQQPGHPSIAPDNLDSYRGIVAQAIDNWSPTILVVEHEEDEPQFFAGPPESTGPSSSDHDGSLVRAYGKELNAACSVAHAHHILCANGGLSSETAAAAAWFWLLDHTDADRACDFAKRAFYTESDANAGQSLCQFRHSADVPGPLRDQLLRQADRLLALYRDIPVDRINFHWYGHDALAFAETVQALQALTGKPIMSNEVGLHPWDFKSTEIRPLMRAAFALHVDPMIWFSVDTATATSLFDADGRLRPAGQEYAHQMAGLK